jgi:hypothetical protein
MPRSRDQLPGLLPPFAEWTLPQILGGLLVAAVVLLPWFFLFVLVWALMATPEGGGSPGF